MDTKYATVVDGNGYKKAFVLIEARTENGEPAERPFAYTMNAGESLIYDDYQTANAMVKPRWTGSAWEETATPEEIAAARPQPPEPPTPAPTNAELYEQNLMIMGAIAELYEKIIA